MAHIRAVLSQISGQAAHAAALYKYAINAINKSLNDC
jgi:hypothetical protein